MSYSENESYTSTTDTNQDKTSLFWGFAVFIFGIAVSSITLLVKDLPIKNNFIHWLEELFDEIGIALIILGAFSIILETKAWRDYFGKRLSDIIVEQKFLENLNPEQLSSFQANLLKARFQNQDIARKGSFSKYCIDNIQDYINLPYRGNVDIMIRITENGFNKNIFEVEDDIVYYCRKTKENIQKKIFWFTDPNEIVCLDYLEINLRHNSICFNKDQHLEQTLSEHVVIGRYEKEKYEKERSTYKGEGSLQVTHEDNGQINAECDIDKYKDIENLEIFIKSKYSIKKGSIQNWRTKYPTYEATVIVKYPEKCDVEYKVFGVDGKQVSTNVGKGFFWVKSSSWMLPNSGIAWTVRERNSG